MYVLASFVPEHYFYYHFYLYIAICEKLIWIYIYFQWEGRKYKSSPRRNGFRCYVLRPLSLTPSTLSCYLLCSVSVRVRAPLWIHVASVYMDSMDKIKYQPKIKYMFS